MEATIEVDQSFENYTPPEAVVSNETDKFHKFIENVKQLAANYGVDYFVATRNGLYAYQTGDSEVLKAIAKVALEENGKPENIPMNN